MKNQEVVTVPVFKIYKEGTTETPVTIRMDVAQPFDIEAKKAFYKELGYTVTEL